MKIDGFERLVLAPYSLASVWAKACYQFVLRPGVDFIKVEQ